MSCRRNPKPLSEEPDSPRVLVIGLDGATFRILLPLIAGGELPNLKSTIENGTRGILKSTVPPTTPPAWTSIFTGRKPANHGVFDFSYQVEGSYERKIVNSTHRRAEAIWTFLSRAGKKVCIINVPVTYPPDEVNGHMVCGMLTPNVDSDFTFPPGLRQELLKRFPDYAIDPDEELHGKTLDGKQRFLAVERSTKRLKDIAISMLEKMKWDFFAVVFVGPDRVQHLLGVDVDGKSSVSVDRNLLVAHMKTIDSCLGEILAKVDSNVTVIICSDHGFRKASKRVHAVNWLARKGFLRFEKGEEELERGAVGLSRLLGIVRTIMRKALPRRAIRFLDSSAMITKASWLFRRRLLQEGGSAFNIDWDKTEAYFVSESSQAISVNLEGRDVRGIVKPGEQYDNLLDRITEGLRALRDPENGRRIVQDVLRGKEVHKGIFEQEAPDLYVVTNEGYRLTGGFSLFGEVRYLNKIKGDHDPDGILILKGPGIKEGCVLDDARVEDIMPTSLYAMGLPISTNLDGRILLDAFRDEFLRERPAVFKGNAPGRIVTMNLARARS